MYRLAIGVLLALLIACGGGSADDQPASHVPLPGGFAPEMDIDLSQMTHLGSGLYCQDLKEGEGAEVSRGAKIVAHYTGWLTDGTKFDSSLDSGRPLAISIGVGEVIDGWDQGIPGMKVGGIRKLVIPPELGYGAAGSGAAIPPNATLVFEVEILELK